MPLDAKNSSFRANGLNMDILAALQSKLNFTTHLSRGNGSWSDMIYLVNQKKLDFGAVGFSQVSFSSFIQALSSFLSYYCPIF